MDCFQGDRRYRKGERDDMKSYQETVGFLKVTDISVEGKEFENANKRWCSCWKKNSEEVGGDAASSK